MAKVKTGKDNIDEFKKQYKAVSDFSSAANASKNHPRPDKKDKNLDKLKQPVYDYLLDKKHVFSADIKSAKDLSDQDVLNYMGDASVNLLETASHTASQKDSLETMLQNAKDENISKTLEAVFSNQQLASKFNESAGKEYKDWVGMYGEYIVEKDRVKRAKEGKLTHEEQELYSHLVRKNVIEQTAKDLKGKPMSRMAKARAGEIRAELTLAGKSNKTMKDLMAEAVEKEYKKAEEKFRKYESEKGVDSKGYISTVLRTMIDSDVPEDAMQALGTLYSTVK